MATLKAGQAFRELFGDDPAVRADLLSIGDKYRPVFDAIRRHAKEWERHYGEPMPTKPDELMQWAIRVGWDGEVVRRGRFTLRELLPFVEGKLLQLNDQKRTADKKTDKEKKLPPNDVNDCARYVVDQRRLIAAGKRPAASKKALVVECVGELDAPAMERQLRPSRFGWLLDRADK